jgi:hypothetical protein
MSDRDLKTEWRPIQTAPRDGTWFLAADVNDCLGGVPSLYAAAFYEEDEDRRTVWQVHCGQYVCEAPSPTHWSPMPALPRGE